MGSFFKYCFIEISFKIVSPSYGYDQFSGIETTSFRDPENFPLTSAIQGNPRQQYARSSTMEQFPGNNLRMGNQDPVRQEVIR